MQTSTLGCFVLSAIVFSCGTDKAAPHHEDAGSGGTGTGGITSASGAAGVAGNGGGAASAGAAGSGATEGGAAGNDAGDSGAAGDGGGGAAGGAGGANGGGAGGSAGAAGQGGSDAGLGEPLFEGVIWVEHREDTNGDPTARAEALFWEPGSALGSVRDYWDDRFGTGYPLAVGECAAAQTGVDPGYTAQVPGPNVVLGVNGADLVVADGPPNDYYWGESTDAAVDQLMTTTFSIEIDPGDGAPVLSATGLGPLAEATPPVGVTCTHGVACTMTVVPSEAVSDFLFQIGTAYVCRGDGTTGEVTMSVAALAAVPNGTFSGRVYYYDRENIALGASTVELVKLTTRVFPIVVQ